MSTAGVLETRATGGQAVERGGTRERDATAVIVDLSIRRRGRIDVRQVDEERRAKQGTEDAQAGPFGEQLRRLRVAAGWSQDELAARAGLTGQAVGALERGDRRHPYPATVRRLADALGLSADRRAALFASVPRRGAKPAGPCEEGLAALDASDTMTGQHTALRRPTCDPPGLPAPLTALVGREADVAAVVGLLHGGTRLLTLTGPGGVGKTRLAIEIAAEAAAQFADSVAFVSLASLAQASLVLSTVAHTLGLRDAGDRPLPTMLSAALSGRRALLVLDNCEHVLAAGPEIARLLEACPQLMVLATSRAPLKLRGERMYHVAPLAVPDLSNGPALEEVAGAPAAQLFVERAQAACPDFALTEANAAAVAAICRRLDGLPLALELAAARIKVLPPTVLLARLDRTLPLLTGGAQDVPERQRSMRDTIAWSYKLLDERERALFRRLAVFAGGCTLDAAAVCTAATTAEMDVLDALGSLVDKNLLSVREGADGGSRLVMLEMIREYALELLQAGGRSSESQRDPA